MMKLFSRKTEKSEDCQVQTNQTNRKGFKSLLPLCLIVILAGGLLIGGTIAYLKANTGTVTNTFKAGNITYTLTLNGNADNVYMPAVLTPQTKTSLSVIFKPDKAPTKTGYLFDGWYYDAACQNLYPAENISVDGITVNYGDSHDSNSAPNKVEITLYAKWTPITYTVKYDDNVDSNNANVTQPTGSTADSTHTYDVAKNLTRNGYERTGYTFIGWNTQPGGNGDSYADGESVTNLTSVQGDIVTLYAQWGAKSYVIRYHANGGSGNMADQAIQYDVPTVLSKNTFTKNDYSFGGWALSENGEAAYIDEQTVVNLLESGTLDLYAVWIQNSHTLYFDYNGGTGSPASKQVQNGKAYGVLPEYPVHPAESVSDTEVITYLFTGWYTEPKGGTRVYPSDLVNRTDDHTLYAHWEEAPSNNVIKDIVVKNNPDDDGDGVVDDVYLNLKCSSSFEKFNIPLKNLIKGQTYKITYNASNNASFGDYVTGYKTSVYGSYIVDTRELTGGRIDTDTSGVPYYGKDLLATWNDRIEPDGSNDGSHAATNDSYLQGPWKNRTITFTATQSTMYWTWDFGLMEDGILDDYNITDIVLEPVVPEIKFADKDVIKGNSSVAKIVSQSNSTYNSTFEFDGDGGCETVYWPITGLSAGMTYTITFDHEFSGPLIHDTQSNPNPTYEYGCGIMNEKPKKTGDKIASLGTWASSAFVKKTVDKKVDGVTLTFEATGSTAYWVWNMANCSDSANTTTKVTVTNFSASNDGKSITYYTAASKAGSAATLDLLPEESQPIELIWDGIDDTHIPDWYPLDESYPVPGDDYELAFEPEEGYTMSEIITVAIDDEIYEVYTDGQEHRELGEDETELPVMPAYDSERNILTIPGSLLTGETKTVEITASAVEIVVEEPPVTEEGEDEQESESAPPETGINVRTELTNMKVQSDADPAVGTDYKLTLTPEEGYGLPEKFIVKIDDVDYDVYTDGLEHRVLAEGEETLPPAPAFDPASDNTLTIPGVLLTEETETITVIAEAVKIDVDISTGSGETTGDSETENDTAEDETDSITVEMILEHLTAESEGELKVGEDYHLLLTLEEGYQLPEVLQIAIDGIVYEVRTDGEDNSEAAEGEELPAMPTFDPETNTLTIPADLLGETAETVTVTITAEAIIPKETEYSDESE